jgi:hypothetical protein
MAGLLAVFAEFEGYAAIVLQKKVGHAEPFTIPLAAERKERIDDPKAE